MNRLHTAAAAVLALVAAPAAFAQSGPAPADPGMPNAQAPAAQAPVNDQGAPAAMSAESAGVNTGAIVYQSSPTPADQAYTLKAGDPTVVSNAPVPDTKANRARYGRPLSTTGRKTAPAGN